MSERSLYLFNALVELVKRSEDGCDMRRFRFFSHSVCKTVLNMLETIYLRHRKTVVERVWSGHLLIETMGCMNEMTAVNPVIMRV